MTLNKKKVLFFTSGFVGGAERVTITIAKLLPKDEYEPVVVHVCRKIENLDKFVPGNMVSRHIKIRNIWDFTTLRIYNLIRKEKPYAVFCSLNYLNIRVINAAKSAKVKKIIVRNNIGFSSWSLLTRFLAKRSYKKVSSIVLQTKDMELEFNEAMPDLKNKTRVIPNPLDTDTIVEKLKYIENPYHLTTSKNFVFVGRVNAVKGLDVLLDSYSQVVKKIPDSNLTIVGGYEDAEYHKRILKQIERLRIGGHVNLVGFSDNPYKYIKYADCFILPSRNEGNPNVLHEAMYLQTPVVATRSIPIIDEIVTKERGYTIPVDDVNSMTKAMISASSMTIDTPYEYEGGKEAFIQLFK